MDREKFWKNKYLKEHQIDLIISLIFSVVLVFLLRWRLPLMQPVFNCIIVFLVLVVIDLLYFMRRMNQYVREMLAEEEAGEHPEDPTESEDSDG